MHKEDPHVPMEQPPERKDKWILWVFAAFALVALLAGVFKE